MFLERGFRDTDQSSEARRWDLPTPDELVAGRPSDPDVRPKLLRRKELGEGVDRRGPRDRGDVSTHHSASVCVPSRDSCASIRPSASPRRRRYPPAISPHVVRARCATRAVDRGLNSSHSAARARQRLRFRIACLCRSFGGRHHRRCRSRGAFIRVVVCVAGRERPEGRVRSRRVASAER